MSFFPFLLKSIQEAGSAANEASAAKSKAAVRQVKWVAGFKVGRSKVPEAEMTESDREQTPSGEECALAIMPRAAEVLAGNYERASGFLRAVLWREGRAIKLDAQVAQFRAQLSVVDALDCEAGLDGERRGDPGGFGEGHPHRFHAD